MKYRLSDRDLVQLNLLIPISEIRKHLPEYTPPLSTIYKRLNLYINQTPASYRKDFDNTLLKGSAECVSDLERRRRIKQIKKEMLLELVEKIKKKARKHEEITL